MIRRIVVPLDGSPEAAAILPHVRGILRRKCADVVLVQAVGWPFAETYGFMGPSLVSGAEKDLREARRSLDEGEGRRVRTVARFGIPARVILQVAEQEEASLVAMTTKSGAGWSRVLFGSVTEEVIRRSRAPILAVPVVPGTDEEATASQDRGLRRILVPYDDTRAALCLLQPVVELAQLFDAEVLLLSLTHDSAPSDWRKAETKVDLASLIRKRDVRAITIESPGPALEEIQAAAWANEADLVALALQNPPGASRVAQPAFVRKALRRSRKPVLVVRDRLRASVDDFPPLRIRTAG